jgi:hypothetical protein
MPPVSAAGRVGAREIAPINRGNGVVPRDFPVLVQDGIFLLLQLSIFSLLLQVMLGEGTEIWHLRADS